MEILLAELVQESGRPADVQALLAGLDELGERRGELGEELALGVGELRILEARPQLPRAELEPRDLLVQIHARPLGEARVDRSP